MGRYRAVPAWERSSKNGLVECARTRDRTDGMTSPPTDRHVESQRLPIAALHSTGQINSSSSSFAFLTAPRPALLGRRLALMPPPIGYECHVYQQIALSLVSVHQNVSEVHVIYFPGEERANKKHHTADGGQTAGVNKARLKISCKCISGLVGSESRMCSSCNQQ